MDIAIIGGGITGLTAALSLHAAGLRCVVYEAVARPEPLGVGINLLPHAMRELTELGLLAEVRNLGVEIDDLVYLTKHGKPIWQEPRGIRAGYRWPQIAVHRGQLQMLLLRAVQARLGAAAVRFGHVLRDLEVGSHAVVAHFQDRARGCALPGVRCDVVAAADGIHSTVRRSLYPDEGPPKWNGRMLWRSTSHTARVLDGRSMVWAGHARQKFVAYPIRYDAASGSTELNWICELEVAEGSQIPPRQDWNRTGDAGEFMGPFQEWRWPAVDVPQIVRAAGHIYTFPMVDRDPLPRWTHGSVTLLGDAAHPMYPIGSNGATQGIIDARSFAYHLAQGTDAVSGLRSYESERRPATERIVRMNRENGPDQVMELAEQRAPARGDDLEALLPLAERSKVASEYKRVAGFDPAALNTRRSYDRVGGKAGCQP
jgi:2-polyprenyl-6-methoxyphenol hydroxylase-like FAD-dependent oxidoreductase